MKYTSKILSLFVLLNILFVFQGKCDIPYGNYSPYIITQQIRFDPNNIDTWIQNSGIADIDLRTMNSPGFQWPRGSGKFAIFADGLTVGAMVNGSLRSACASYKGEYTPGYITDSLGLPVARTDIRFKFYKVSRGDNYINNQDWANWGLMVPFGAPYIDVNHNGVYEYAIDTPGVRGASQTIFICLTDGFPEIHQIGEGFGGGTAPMFAELHITAWGYDNPGYLDMIFKKFELINKNDTIWNSTYTAIVADPDLGCSWDDYIGCDTVRKLGFCYNGDNNDTGSSYGYGVNPPAVGIKWLNCSGINNTELTSFTYYSSSQFAPYCERDPNGEPLAAYYMLKGLKKDRTPWVIPPGGNPQYITKYCYSGDPETGTGWNEGIPGSPSGSVENCGGPYVLAGDLNTVNLSGDRRMIMSSGADNNNISPNDTIRILIAQLIARGTNNLNSVTKLKQLSDIAQNLCNNGFIIGVNNISTEVPNSFTLYQNYPNPFNPVTKIKFSLPSPRWTSGQAPSEGGVYNVRLVVYDVLGREVATLIPPPGGGQVGLKPGTYEADWDASNYPSGVYFYKLIVSDASAPLSITFSETKKMVLMK